METNIGRNQEQLCDVFGRESGSMGGKSSVLDPGTCRKRYPQSIDLWRDAVRRHSDARSHWRSLLGQHLVPHKVRD